MAVYFPVPNGHPLAPSKPDIDAILTQLTRTPSDILGEAPLPPLPPPPPSKPSLSYDAAIAITNAFRDPISILGEQPLPKQLPPRKPNKRTRTDQPSDTKPKRRKKEDKHSSLTTKRPKSVLPPKPNTNSSPRSASSQKKKSKAEPALVNDKPLNNAHKPSVRRQSKLQKDEPTVTKTENVLKRPGKGKLSDSAPAAPSIGLRSSPLPVDDSKNARKEKSIKPKLRSELPVPTDTNGARKIKKQPMLRSSPVEPSAPKDSSKDKPPRPSFRSVPARSSEAKNARKEKDAKRVELRSSPVQSPDEKDTPKEKGTGKSKSRTAAAPRSESARTESKNAAKKPPHSVPASRHLPIMLRSKPVPPKPTSPEPNKKVNSSNSGRRASSSKADLENGVGKAVAKERREQKRSSRRRDDSPEPRQERVSRPKDETPDRRRRADRGYARKQRDSSVDQKRRDSDRRRAKDIDDDLSDRIAHRSKHRDADKDVDSDREYDRRSDQSNDNRSVKGRNTNRRRRQSYADHDRDTESGLDSKKGGEKRKRETDRVHDVERDRKVGRKDGWSGSDTPARSSQEREDSLSPRNFPFRSVRPGYDDNSKDRIQPKSNRDTKNDHNSDSSGPEKTKQRDPKLRAVAVPPSGTPKVPQSTGLVSRPVRDPSTSSAARASGPKFGQEISAMMTSEERRKSADDLKRIVAEQKELLSQFDSLTKLCDEYLSKKKHDDFEGTVKKAFRVYFNLCLKKETELRMLARANREWGHVKEEAISRYRYLSREFGPKREEELKQLGRTKSAQFISHQVHKVYLRRFVLHRCWDKEQRLFESDARRTTNDLFRDGTLSKSELFGKRAWFVRQAVDDYACLMPLLDAITADWGDGDHFAGFEMNIPSDSCGFGS